MPFAAPHGSYYSLVYEPAIKKAGLKPVRADSEIFGAGKIMDQIWSGINAAKVLVAELTTKNPNVFYELGLAHALKKPVVLVSSNEKDVPFDLQDIRVIYSTTTSMTLSGETSCSTKLPRPFFLRSRTPKRRSSEAPRRRRNERTRKDVVRDVDTAGRRGFLDERAAKMAALRKHRCEKAIHVVQVWTSAEKAAWVEQRCQRRKLRAKLAPCEQSAFTLLIENLTHDLLVLFRLQGTGGVDQPSSLR